MNRGQKIAMIEFTVIILLWTLVVISPLLFMNEYSQNWRAVHVMWVECAVIGCIFLINRFLLMPRLFFTKRYTHYIASLALLLILLGVFIIHFDGINKILSFFVEGNSNHSASSQIRDIQPHRMRPPRNVPIIPPMFGVLIISAIVIALDMGLNIAIKWVLSEQKRADIDRENSKAQLSNLQSQISPHFFMNTLNNIHALVDIDPARAKQTIIELSSLMDYLLYNTYNQELVPLQKEINFIESYINLMRIRFSEQVEIGISYNKSVPMVKTTPFLFLNFIENSFKYGIDSELESFVKIAFDFSDDTIEMVAINSNHSQSAKGVRRGVGIANSRKRLELLYGNQYSLDINENEKTYSVTLKIPIK